MTKLPIIHKYHFSDNREQILAKLETIFQMEHRLATMQPAGHKYVGLIIEINSTKISTVVILVNDNAVIYTSFPEDDKRYPRLWMVNSFIGQITYIEIENPELRNINKIDFKDPLGNAYEMGLMPHDTKLINEILDKFIIKLSSDIDIDSNLLNSDIKKLIAG